LIFDVPAPPRVRLTREGPTVRARLTPLLLGAAAVSLAASGAAVAAVAPTGATLQPTHVRYLPTYQAAKKTAHNAVSTDQSCLLSTLSPACLPDPLEYGGGAVQGSNVKEYAVFWEPPGSTVSTNYNQLLTQFLSDIVGSSLYGVAAQYTDAGNHPIQNTAQFGAAVTDTDAFPHATLTDADIQHEVTKEIAANGWQNDVDSEVFVFLPKGVNQCMDSSNCFLSPYCAYHNFFNNNGATVTYGVMPYAGTDLSACGTQGLPSPNNNPDADAEISIASHELLETVTDPTLAAWSDLFGFEIGDKCEYTYGATKADGSNVSFNGHHYTVQEEFSDNDLGCVLS
jgi:hypothetical protein